MEQKGIKRTYTIEYKNKGLVVSELWPEVTQGFAEGRAFALARLHGTGVFIQAHGGENPGTVPIGEALETLPPAPGEALAGTPGETDLLPVDAAAIAGEGCK